MNLDLFNTFTGLVGHLDKSDTLFSGDLIKDILVFLSEVFKRSQIRLREDNAKGLVLEERLDGVEQADLLFNTVRALFR